jgi:hypothetical protein
MKTKQFYLPFLVACVLGFAACDTEQSIPAYLYIPAVNLNVTDTAQGTNTSKIIDAWVYANDNLVGGFRVPATVPIIGEGNTKITVIAGVAENGNFSTPSNYPFYDAYNVTKNLKPGTLDTIKPVVTYSTTNTKPLKFWICDFENSNKFAALPDPAYADTSIAMKVAGLPGSKYGYIRLTNQKRQVVCGSSQRITPDLKKQVWVEVDYKGTNSITLGVIGYKGINTYRQYASKTAFIPKPNWNKIYLSLGKEMIALNESNGATEFQVSIVAIKDENSAATTEVNVDNIKVIYTEP